MKNTKKLSKNIVWANCVRPQKNNKTNANVVGADSISARENGITLIALIITIIVMLILVGVTINVALNGGLFEKTKGAKNDTIREMDREELYSAVVASYDARTNTIIRSDLIMNLGEEWTVSEGEAPWTCTSKNENSFIVDSDGTIEYIKQEKDKSDEDDQQAFDELWEYTIGSDGKAITDFVGQDKGLLELYLLPDNKNQDSTIHQKAKIASLGSEGLFIRYKGRVYKVIYDNTAKTSDLIAMDKLEGNLGKYVKYNNIDWIVLSEDLQNKTVELISANALQVNSENIKLGLEDSTIPADLEGINENKNLAYEKVRYSYNNAVKTLNQAARLASGIDDLNIPVRSVGCISSELEDDLSAENTYGGHGEFRLGDENYNIDLEKMVKVGVLGADNCKPYWLASRNFDEKNYGSYKTLRIRSAASFVENYIGEPLGTLDGDKMYNHRTFDYAVRPIITLSSDSLFN